MRRIALGRATLLSVVTGLLLAQGASGCGSTATPGDAKGGASEEGGSPGETGGFGASAGEADSGAPGETGGAGAAGGMGGRGGGGGSSSGFTSGGASDGGRAGGGAIGGKAGSTAGGKAGGTSVSGGTAGTSFGGKAGGTGVSGGTVGTTGGFGGTFGGTSGGFATGGFATGGIGKGGGLGTGGVPSCVNGAACTCSKGDGTVGTVTCDASGGSECVCPPAEQCTAKGEAPCFEPCGGEPFGAWVLEDSCFPRTLATGNSATCSRFAEGTPGANALRMRILDGGALEVYGYEDWTIATQEALSCLPIQSVKSCQFSSVWPDSLLFSNGGQVGCTENACGVCDCEGTQNAQVSQFNFQNWSRSGKNLQLGFRNVPYCAKADELWVGGLDATGTPKVSYKFKKQSCQGKPLACAERTAEQCNKGFNCQVGACRGASGTVPRCATAWDESSCGVLQGCVWDPDGCAGTAGDSCEFATCGDEPGCTWGPPKERCGGSANACEDRDVTQCTGGGCSVRVCQPNGAEYGACQLLSTAVDCGKAPGCSWAEGSSTCTGTSLCAAQTDTAVCGKLNCWANSFCGGVPTECASLSLDACPDTLGCRLEW